MLVASTTFPQLRLKTFRGSGEAKYKWIKRIQQNQLCYAEKSPTANNPSLLIGFCTRTKPLQTLQFGNVNAQPPLHWWRGLSMCNTVHIRSYGAIMLNSIEKFNVAILHWIGIGITEFLISTFPRHQYSTHLLFQVYIIVSTWYWLPYPHYYQLLL